jgi:hypothetical protein
MRDGNECKLLRPEGEGLITVNEQFNLVKSHSLIVTSPATISTKCDEEMRLLGV